MKYDESVYEERGVPDWLRLTDMRARNRHGKMGKHTEDGESTSSPAPTVEALEQEGLTPFVPAAEE